MSAGALATGLPARGPRPVTERLIPVLALLLTVPVGCALALGLSRTAAPLPLAMLAGAALVAVVGLALVRYSAAVTLAIALLGVALIEPSPSDAIFVVLIAFAAVTGRFRPSRAPRSVLAILTLFGALCLISAIEVVDVAGATLFFGITLYLALVALWLSSYVSSRRRARLVLRAYVFAAVASAFLGTLALVVGFPGAERLVSGGRVRALFADPNVFGPFLVPAALLLLEEIVRPQLLRARTSTKAIMLGVVVVGVVFSYSRGAWLNLVIGLLVVGSVILVRGTTRELAALLVAVAAAAVIVPAAITATGSADFLAERARPQAYDAQRFSGQSAGLRAADTYVFGAGPGQFEAMAGIAAHSTYARALGEQGYPGLVAVLALLGLTLVLAARNAVRRRSVHGLGSAALLGAWCGIIVNSAFVDTLHWRHLWVLAALIWIVPRRGEGRP